MSVTVYTGGKVSKAKGYAVAVAVIEGLPEGDVIAKTIHPIAQHPTPNSVAMIALTLGVGVALAKGATDVQVFTPSKNAAKAVDGTGGAKYETARDAYLTAHAITWTRNLGAAGGSWSVGHRAAADMPRVAEAAADALKRAEGLLAPSGALF